jgi:hypothetical protein
MVALGVLIMRNENACAPTGMCCSDTSNGKYFRVRRVVAAIAVLPCVVWPRMRGTLPRLAGCVNMPAVIASVGDFHFDKIANIRYPKVARDCRVSAESISRAESDWTHESVGTVDNDG